MATAPSQIIERTRDVIARHRRRAGLAMALAVVPVFGLISVTLDASAALPAWARLMLVVLLMLGSLGMGFVLLVAWRWLAPTPQQGQRLAEQALGDVYRQVTTSLELRQMPGELAARGAQQCDERIDDSHLVKNLPQSRWLRVMMIAGVACLLAGVTHVVRPTLFSSVLPRLFDPFGDHPPYSLTTLSWVEVPTALRPPQVPRFVIQALGPLSQSTQRQEYVVEVHDAADTPVARLVMLAMGGNQWSASMAAIELSQLTTLQSPLRAWVSGAGTRTHFRYITLDPIPQLTGGTLLHISPSYGRLPDDKRTLGKTEITLHALPDSRLVVTPTSNRPISSLSVARDGVIMTTSSTGTADINNPSPGAWTLVLTASDEANKSFSSEPIPLATVTRRIDALPIVRYEQPMTDGVATPGMVIPLVLQASDDLGLTRLSRYRIRNGVRETESREKLGGTSDTWRGGIPTAGLVAGDTLRIGAVATDSKPPDGQVSEPAERIIHIMSDKDYNALVMEQIDQHALSQKYGSLLERIAKLETALAEKIAEQQSIQPSSQTPEQRRSALEDIAEQAAALHREVEALRRPEPLFAAEPDIQRALQEHLAALEQAAKDGKSFQPQAQQLQKDLDMLRLRAEHKALVEHLGELAEAQRITANELAELKQNGIKNDADRARLREASRKQQAMEQALREWQLAAKQVQEQLQTTHPKEASALGDLVQDIQQGQIESLVGQASRSARAGRVDDAQRDAEEAAKKLERFAKNSWKSGECKGPGWCSGDSYGKCLSQLAGLAKRGYNPGESVGASGGGATGASGGGMMVKRGGHSSPKAQQLQLYGPETLKALAGATSGNQQQGNTSDPAAANLDAASHRATAYATDVRPTTAGVGASFSPAEEKLIEDYFRLLDEEADKKK